MNIPGATDRGKISILGIIAKVGGSVGRTENSNKYLLSYV